MVEKNRGHTLARGSTEITCIQGRSHSWLAILAIVCEQMLMMMMTIIKTMVCDSEVRSFFDWERDQRERETGKPTDTGGQVREGRGAASLRTRPDLVRGALSLEPHSRGCAVTMIRPGVYRQMIIIIDNR